MIFTKFKMFDCNPVNTPMKSGIKLSKFEEGEKVDSSPFKNRLGSLRYLTCTRSNVPFAVEVVSRSSEAPTSTYLKVSRIIFHYLKGMRDLGLFCSSSNDFNLVEFCDSNYAEDVNDIKSTSSFVFFLG